MTFNLFKQIFFHKWQDNGEKYICQSFRLYGQSVFKLFVNIN